MDKNNFRLDRDRINSDFSRPDDTKRVNDPRKRPARPEPRRMNTGGHGPTPQNRPRRPVPPQGQQQRPLPPYPPERQAQPQLRQPPPPRKRVKRSVPRQEQIPPEQLYPYMQPEPEPEYIPPKPKKHRLARLLIRIAVICIVIIFLNVLFFYYSGELWFNEPRKRDYPVRGAVVTEKLGKVNWEKFAGQSMSFVYIRATRGTSETDLQYKDNRRGANSTDLLCGYYHEFDFRLDGKKQAEHYIRQVEGLDGKLVPMVKVTRYGLYRVYHKDAQETRKQLSAFLDRIYEEYGCDCIIQCDKDCYERYVKGELEDQYYVWLISHFTEPDKEDAEWALWEYNPRGRSSAYRNKSKYYCMSVCRKGVTLSRFRKDFLIQNGSDE